MKSVFTTLVFILFFLASYGQKPCLDNVIFLKNGSKIKGQIISLIPDEKIEIETYDGSVFVYTMDEIEKIEFEASENKTAPKVNLNKNIELSEAGYKKSGYLGIIEIGGLFSIDETFSSSYLMSVNNQGIGSITGFHFAAINGYQFNERLSLGLGIGIRSYSVDYSEIPLFIDFRYTITKKKIAPILCINTGYTQELNGGEGTFEFGGGLGMKNYISPNNALYFTLGSNFHYYESGAYIGFLDIKAGISF